MTDTIGVKDQPARAKQCADWGVDMIYLHFSADERRAVEAIYSSGDHLLRQIVRQISRRLTWKVQEDFHATHGLECPPRRRAPAGE